MISGSAWPERRNCARHARSLSARRVRQRFVAAALSVAAAVALAVVAGPPAVRMLTTPSVAPLRTAAQARNAAAAWVTRWVAAGATIGCDPAMCAVLRAHQVPAARLWLLTSTAVDPMNCDVVVATPAIRSQFLGRLASVYAPVRLASFGRGGTRVDVRSIDTIGDTVRYLRAVRAGVRSRRLLGRYLLANPNIAATAAAARVLAAGGADPGLLLALPVLAGAGPVTILRFGRRPRGASYGMPVLSVDLTGGPAPAGSTPVTSGYARVRTARWLARLRNVLRDQRTPLRAARIRELTTADGLTFLRIDYAAPAPLTVYGGTLESANSR
ncbi:MAG TPA: hypothetical protein VF843_04540 [Streptosporangiaceae bacterium]